jgi:hypothetical protein
MKGTGKLVLWILALIGITLAQVGMFFIRGLVTNQVWLLV